MKDNMILEVKNVEKFFYGNKKLFQKDRPVVKAVNDVSFTINQGETLGIVGESGCGKTVMCRSVMKLLPPNAHVKSGEISLCGENITAYKRKKMEKLCGSKVSMEKKKKKKNSFLCVRLIRRSRLGIRSQMLLSKIRKYPGMRRKKEL